jgi:hypothetical protein
LYVHLFEALPHFKMQTEREFHIPAGCSCRRKPGQLLGLAKPRKAFLMHVLSRKKVQRVDYRHTIWL